MSARLKSLLNRFRVLEGIDLAAVVASDGLLIESSARAGVDVDAISAVASHSLTTAETLGREVNKGSPVHTFLQYEQGMVLVEPLTSEAMLVLLSSDPDELGVLRFLVAMHRRELADAVADI